jgi:formylglycine-generating enzyme required for sulfatase activity
MAKDEEHREPEFHAFPGDDPTLIVDPGESAPALSAAELRRRLGLPEDDDIRDYGELRTIGVGGMGAVFSGREPGLMREVALKMLRPAYRWIPERITAFIREARTTAQISHPNIVPVHRIGVFEGAGVYFAMKRVRGQTLRSIISALADGDAELRRRFTLRRMLEIFIAACNGVSFAHHRGVLHCDLKPANLMVGDYGEVLVMDWGMAQYHEHRTAGGESGVDLGGEAAKDRPGTLGGTPAYMAPELLTGELREPDQQTDVYSLGVILYSILTWRPSPYPPNLAREELMTYVCRHRPPPPGRAAHPGQKVPRELEAIALKAMARNRKKRYADVQELLEEVHNFLDGYPVRAYSPNWFYRAVKLLRRRPAVPTVALAALLTWGGFQFWQEMQDALRAEHILNLAGYDFLDAQNADRMLRRDYRKIAEPRLAESAAGEKLRADLNRQKIRMTDKYIAALELLSRSPSAKIRREPRIREMYRGIFRDRLKNELMSRDPGAVRELVEQFRSRWADQFKAAVAADPALRRMVENVDGGIGCLELETAENNWTVHLRRSDGDSRNPVEKTFELVAGEGLEQELPEGNYLLEFVRGGGSPISSPVRVHLALTTRFCFEPPARIEPGFAYIPAREEMDANGCSYLNGAFQMSKNEVTLGEYLKFWNTLPPEDKARCRALLGGDAAQRELWDDAGRIRPPFSPEQPVTGITGDAARKYCQYLSSRLGRRVRLPYEWEWRRAARGTDRRNYPWGDEYRSGLALLADSPLRAKFPFGAPPGSFPGDLSPCGISDMAGNVREFALPSGPDKSLVIVMGGSSMLPPAYAEIGFNQFRQWSVRSDDIGFRCVIEE